jgi:glutamate/aspartate transport system substrate-binding protein
MRFNRVQRALAIASIAAFGLIPLAHAEPLTGTLKKISETGGMTIGIRQALLPFSYYDNEQKVVGYSTDLCSYVIRAIQEHLALKALKVTQMAVTSATRIPLLSNGTIDMECGATTNNAERAKQVSFSVTHFVTSNTFVSKKKNGYRTLEDLKGKSVASVAGTSNIRELQELSGARNLNIKVIPVKDHAEAFLMVQTDRAAAFVMDDVILAGFVSNAKNPAEYEISDEVLSVQPYGFMVRKGDPAFKKIVDDALSSVFKSKEMASIYAKWFESPIPPSGNNLNMPMSEALRRVLINPTDSPDPAAYLVQ